MVRSDVLVTEQIERLRVFTRDIEFNYVSWIIDALAGKLVQIALGGEAYLPREDRPEIVLDYLKLVEDIQRDEARLNDIYADPNVDDPRTASSSLREELKALYQERARLAPVAEAILQGQISNVLTEAGLTLGGQPIPPVMYHSTSLPLALIVSPRDTIRQDFDISIIPGVTVDQQVTLEGKVDKALNVSSLVVPVGGLGIYPTMVMQTTDINWMAEVVSHEWIHNFLTLRPLGVNYYSSPELRTMNETTASIAGKELGRMLIQRYYPEFLPPPPAPPEATPKIEKPSESPVFDFREEMHTTRVTVDKLLAEGKIELAETYMDERRRFFWEHGYHIRKLNQAYFAFYGAYADQPGGAAGEDPVGTAVRALRAQSPTLAGFIKRISLMYSFEQLKRAVNVTRQ
jgi:hypothetical protein